MLGDNSVFRVRNLKKIIGRLCKHAGKKIKLTVVRK